MSRGQKTTTKEQSSALSRQFCPHQMIKFRPSPGPYRPTETDTLHPVEKRRETLHGSVIEIMSIGGEENIITICDSLSFTTCAPRLLPVC